MLTGCVVQSVCELAFSDLLSEAGVAIVSPIIAALRPWWVSGGQNGGRDWYLCVAELLLELCQGCSEQLGDVVACE